MLLIAGEPQTRRLLFGLGQIVFKNLGDAVTFQRHQTDVWLAHRGCIQRQLQTAITDQLADFAVFGQPSHALGIKARHRTDVERFAAVNHQQTHCSAALDLECQAPRLLQVAGNHRRHGGHLAEQVAHAGGVVTICL